MKPIEIVSKEIQTAKEKYGPFNSTHELYGVLKEEVDEFFNEVKKKPVNPEDLWQDAEFMHPNKKERMIGELTQIAAIALRGIDELRNNEIKWI